MSVKLYEHNQIAYQAVCSMLSETGKAAVIHPTGTGKSYIAFHLIEEREDQRFLWLSPSEYIVRSQLESLLAQDPDFPTERVTFLTYARLMLMTSEEISGLCPDYIILDEFHRCGARVWGKGIRTLLETYPSAYVLGLSATAVRYLDNDRDMAEELFDRHVASEMTLGETIVRGILPAPVYISAVYQYEEELKRYQSRIRSLRGRGVQELNQKYLDALRRKLENAKGLDEMFDRCMTDRTGKYIVFCANVDHMKEMQAKAPEWFGRLDSQPNIYTVYAKSPEASREFARFRSDESGHLKLLYCIDMLNEGVHVKGISGVILFRPTVSPIIYKQQIGRALTAGDTKIPLIIDVVNNAESLCSIDSLQKEMADAALWLRQNGHAEEIVTESFEVREQAEDCRRLFEQLEASLSSSWDQYFQAAKAFSRAHGNSLAELPRRYVSPDGLSVGSWIQTQKLVRAGRQLGTLTDAQISLLDSIGMIWENRLDLQFEKNFHYAEAYAQTHGDLLVPSTYRTEDGFPLGVWINNLRQRYTSGERSGMLNPERISRLETIGMCWNISDHNWEKHYAQAAAYYREHGSIADVPAGYRTPDGFALGMWLQSVRRTYQGKTQNRFLTQSQIDQLEAIGMRWDSRYEELWMQSYEAAKQYYDTYGPLTKLSVSYITPEGLPLGRWIRRQRLALVHPGEGEAKISEEHALLLEKIGIRRDEPTDAWEQNFAVLKNYQEQFGTLDLPQDVIHQGVWIGKWLSLQKKSHDEGTLSQEHTKQLESIGYDWMNRSERQWQLRYQEAADFYHKHGHLRVSREQSSLRRWLQKQNVRHSKGQLKPSQIYLLEQSGMNWEN